MDANFLISIATQIPLVAFFAWFVIRRDKDTRDLLTQLNKDWREFLEKERELSTDTLKDIRNALEALTRQITKITAAVVVLHEATVRNGFKEVGSTKDVISSLLTDTEKFTIKKAQDES